MSVKTVSDHRCSVEGCEKKREKRGWCGMHYRRWQRHGDVRETRRVFLTFRRPEVIQEFLWAQKKLATTTGCWIWDGWGGRYGKIHIDGATYAVHRVMGHLALGLHLDSDLCVLHKCDVTRCINPAHLFIGTQKENVHDMFSKGRDNHARGERTNTAKLPEEAVREIRRRHASGESALSLSKEFGVTSPAVDAIIHRRSWRHIV